MNLDHIENLREQIDELDRSLLAILEARVALSRGLGALKRAQSLPLRDEIREQTVLRNLLVQSQDADLQKHLAEIYQSISQCCLQAQVDDDAYQDLDEYASQLEENYEITAEELAEDTISTQSIVQSDEHDHHEHSNHTLLDASTQFLVPQQNVDLITFDQTKESNRRLGALIRFKRRNQEAKEKHKEKNGVLSESQRHMLLHTPFAHRGLHDLEQQIPENSLLAFSKSIEHGYGIELDVHLTADHIPVVFHDDDLQRMTGIDDLIATKTWAELQQMNLMLTDEKIPSLSQVLALVDGQVPLLVEIKNYREPVGALEGAVAHLLDAYQGEFCVQSFNPMVLKWFLKNRPHFIRGLISYAYPVEEVQLSASTRFLLRNLLLSPLCKPHYIAYDYKDLNRFKLRHLHRMRAKGIPLLVWTVRSHAAEQLATVQADNFIFEDFYPQIEQKADVDVHSPTSDS